MSNRSTRYQFFPVHAAFYTKRILAQIFQTLYCIYKARIQGISPPPMGELRELYTLSLLSWSPSADKTPTGTPVPALRIMKSFKGSNVELKLLKLSYFETFKL